MVVLRGKQSSGKTVCARAGGWLVAVLVVGRKNDRRGFGGRAAVGFKVRLVACLPLVLLQVLWRAAKTWRMVAVFARNTDNYAARWLGRGARRSGAVITGRYAVQHLNCRRGHCLGRFGCLGSVLLQGAAAGVCHESMRCAMDKRAQKIRSSATPFLLKSKPNKDDICPYSLSRGRI